MNDWRQIDISAKFSHLFEIDVIHSLSDVEDDKFGEIGNGDKYKNWLVLKALIGGWSFGWWYIERRDHI